MIDRFTNSTYVFCDTMRKAKVLLFLVSQVLHIFGEMTAVRESESNYLRKLICFSDDDDRPLVWTNNLVWKHSSNIHIVWEEEARFYKANGSNNNKIYCKTKENEKCLSAWDTRFWNFTNSFRTPLDPVFDQQWREFKKYEYFEDGYDYVNLKNINAVAFSFSVRVIGDVHILLCNSKKYNADFCYWIIIGGWQNSKSTIRKCATGVPKLGEYVRNTERRKPRTELNHTPLSATEWRSFIITWNSVTRNISVYDTDNIIMTYTDTESSESSNIDGHVFIRSPNKMLFRFHIYEFLYITVKNATLASSKFELNNKAICIHLLTGFCVECDTNVALRDSTSNKMLKKIKAESSSTIHDLPTWQSIKIRNNLSTIDYMNVTIMSSKYNKTLLSRKIRENTFKNNLPKIYLKWVLSDDLQFTLSWWIPKNPNEKTMQYEVILKVKQYYGCRDLGLPTPNNHIITRLTSNTSITIPELHSYTEYTVQVGARTSQYVSLTVKTDLSTQIAEVPAAKFSQVKVQDWKLLWSPPEDCTTILGPIIAKIKIRGISDAVKDFIETIRTTAFNFLDLAQIKTIYGAERYVATIYAVRNNSSPENKSAYQEIEFETPPKAPPMVINLDVVEIDRREKPITIQLRWQNPLPPLNGKLDSYRVVFCNFNNNNCRYIQVQLNEYCDLWDNYICKIIQTSENSPLIYVAMFNINVTEESPFNRVAPTMICNTIPDAPGNFTFTVYNNSIVDLKWLHPWRTGSPLDYFLIRVEEVSSNLRQHPSRPSNIETHIYRVTNYKRDYSMRFYLLASTDYSISIKSVTITGEHSEHVSCVEFRTPSTINFSGDLEVKTHESNSTIFLNIPRVLNDTYDSVLHVIVNGPYPCEQYTKLPMNLQMQVGLKMKDIAWQAAEVSTSELAGKVFTIGDNDVHGNGTNCPLKSGEMYGITVIITEPNTPGESVMLTTRTSIPIDKISSKHYEMWLILITLLLVVAAIYFYRRKRQKAIDRRNWQDKMALSHYDRCDKCEHDIESVISNLKQDHSTPSDGQSLSRVPTMSGVPGITIEKCDEKRETTSPVKVKDFNDYVRRAIHSGLLDKQYETLPTGQTRPWKLSQNEYENLVAYDDTRVLKKLPNDAYSDYINANYITGYKNCYIAMEGPKSNTVIDFWRMIWQEEVLIICMLTNIIENEEIRCEKYWPDIGKKKKYGDITVLNTKHSIFADYTFRTLHITYGEKTRKVEHLHYTAWPDHGVLLYTHSVVMYLKKLLATPPGDGPVVVHCSDGVGSTGIIVLCDICLHRAATEKVVDVFAETASIRRERANMVSDKQQYLLAHLVLVECLFSLPTSLPCNETLPTRIREMKKQLPVQRHRLQDTAWQDEALRVTCPLSLSKRNRAKNRFPELLSDKIDRIYLRRYPLLNEDGDYLSGVYVDGVRLRNQYLATQLPMPSTINDFWRMIAEFRVELILMLQPPDPNDPTCCAIVPASGEFKPTPYLNVIAKEIAELKNYMSQKLLLIDTSEKSAREQFVTILCSTEWKPGKNQPPPPVTTMMTFWQAAEKFSRGEGLTVTLCHDGVTACGLYLALSFLLERMTAERECDVCLAVRAIRRSRPDFVQSLEHLEYLYDAAATYFKYFETYANFS